MPFPERLIEGYREFLSGRLPQEQSRFRELAEIGQSPEVMVIGCCDSRVSPEVIFDAAPGELFVIRNVANLVPPYTPDGVQRAMSAALEFAVVALKVKHIVVLGHARCGGVRAFVEGAIPLTPSDFIGTWMQLLAPAAESIGPQPQHANLAEYLDHLEHASPVRTLDNLLTFPIVRTRVERGSLQVHAAHFDVTTGLLSVFDPTTKTYASIAGAEHSRLFAQPRF
jgi:carbonic anhydrase